MPLTRALGGTPPSCSGRHTARTASRTPARHGASRRAAPPPAASAGAPDKQAPPSDAKVSMISLGCPKNTVDGA